MVTIMPGVTQVIVHQEVRDNQAQDVSLLSSSGIRKFFFSISMNQYDDANMDTERGTMSNAFIETGLSKICITFTIQKITLEKASPLFSYFYISYVCEKMIHFKRRFKLSNQATA